MSGRRLVILAALLLGVALYYRFYEVDHKTRQEAEEVEAKQLFRFDVTEAATISYTSGEGKITLEKIDSAWRLTEPVTEAADETTVSSLLRSLSTLTPERALENPEELSSYGLKKPEMTLEVGDENDEPLAVLHGGSLTADKLARYVRTKDGSTVGILTSALFDSVNKDLFALRTKKWTHVGVEDVLELRYSREGQPIAQVLRDGPDADSWTVSAVVPKAADADKITRTLSQVINAPIRSVVAESTLSLPQYGLDAPRYTISLSTVEGDLSLRIGNVVPEKTPVEYYAMIGDDARVLTFTSAVIEGVPKSSDDLRQRRIVLDSTAEMEMISLRHAEATVNLKRATGADEWVLVGDDERKAGSVQVEALLRDLSNLEALRFLHLEPSVPSPADFTDPQLTVVYSLRGTAVERQLLLAVGEASGEWYAKREGDDEIYPVSPAIAERLQLSSSDLKDRHLFSFDAERVERIELQVRDRDLVYRKQSDGQWKAGIATPPIEGHLLGQFLWAVSDMVYQREIEGNNPALSEPLRFGLRLSAVDGSTLAEFHIHGDFTVESETLQALRTADDLTVGIESGLLQVWEPILGAGPDGQ